MAKKIMRAYSNWIIWDALLLIHGNFHNLFPPCPSFFLVLYFVHEKNRPQIQEAVSKRETTPDRWKFDYWDIKKQSDAVVRQTGEPSPLCSKKIWWKNISKPGFDDACRNRASSKKGILLKVLNISWWIYKSAKQWSLGTESFFGGRKTICAFNQSNKSGSDKHVRLRHRILTESRVTLTIRWQHYWVSQEQNSTV